MSEWKECKLGELISKGIADLQTGPFGTMFNASEYTDNGTPLIAVQDIGENKIESGKLKYIGAESVNRLSRYKVLENDIIFGRKGSIDKRALISKKEEGWIQGSDCIRLRLNRDINAKFISYQLGSNRLKEWLVQHSHGATMPSLNQEILSLLPLILPPLHEQHAIASVLSSLDDKIDLLHRQNKTLEAMAETLFRQWFVEEADEGWEEGKIYELIDVVYGYPFNSDCFNEEKRGLPLVRIRDLKNGFSNVYTDEKCDDKYVIKCGDLVAGMDGEFRLYIWAGEQSVLNQRLCKFIPRFDFVTQLYVYELMKPHLYYFENVKVGTTVIHLGKADLDEIRISIPAKDLLIKFGEVVNPFYNKLKNNYNQIRTLEKLRDTLLPKLMSGEVRVNV